MLPFGSETSPSSPRYVPSAPNAADRVIAGATAVPIVIPASDRKIDTTRTGCRRHAARTRSQYWYATPSAASVPSPPMPTPSGCGGTRTVNPRVTTTTRSVVARIASAARDRPTSMPVSAGTVITPIGCCRLYRIDRGPLHRSQPWSGRRGRRRQPLRRRRPSRSRSHAVDLGSRRRSRQVRSR